MFDLIEYDAQNTSKSSTLALSKSTIQKTTTNSAISNSAVHVIVFQIKNTLVIHISFDYRMLKVLQSCRRSLYQHRIFKRRPKIVQLSAGPNM